MMPDAKEFVLKLYVAGQSPRSREAVANLRRLCELCLAGCYELTIIDVLEQPQVAEAAKVLATPTLIKELPAPARRIIGDFSDPDRVLKALGLPPRTRAQ